MARDKERLQELADRPEITLRLAILQSYFAHHCEDAAAVAQRAPRDADQP